MALITTISLVACGSSSTPVPTPTSTPTPSPGPTLVTPTQSPAVEPTDSPTSPSSPRKPCDLDGDGDCDRADYDIFSKSVHMCSRDNPVSLPNVGIIREYNPMADANHDGCVALDDKELLFPVIPEK